MKMFSLFAVLVLGLTILTTQSSAQEAENPLLVVSFQKVKFGEMQNVTKMFNDKMSPILNSLVDDQYISSWGLFNHTWGDEWNLNVWYVMEDMASIEVFFDEYMKRLNEQQPDAWKELRGYIMEHKDNIYTIMNQYPMPPTK
jgi:hypothetical protein